jgi:signal transduction histidine kinase
MNRLVNDLLDVASIEAGKLALVPTQIEVAHILRDTLEAFDPIATAKRITLDADTKTLPLHARIDADRILQVLANLVSNAIKFTAPEGRVRIAARGGKSEIHFTVTDTGIGIPQEQLQEVFERFHQVSKDRRGLGLGLYISKCIVEVHGGRMWAESTLGAGSTFHVVLPAG